MAKVVEKKGGSEILDMGAPIDPVLKFVLDEIIATTALVSEFDSEKHAWTASSDWVWRAISPGDRERWAADFFKSHESQKGRFFTQLDKLSDAFDGKVHQLVPDDALFAYHVTTEEALMKKQIDVEKIHAIGIEQKEWEVQYESDKIPKHKIKNGFIWGRDKNEDTPYCRLYQVTLKQQYIGDGKYAETIAVYFNSWPRPCPKGKSNDSSKATKSKMVSPKKKSKSK
jgi:hypothetical protein